MADRQIFQLTTRILALADVLASQDAAGATEAGKATLQNLKELLQGNAKVLVVNMNFSGLFSYSIIENDYGAPLTTILFECPNNGMIDMTLAQPILDPAKTHFIINSAQNGSSWGGQPFLVMPSVFSTTKARFDFVDVNGTRLGTPNLNNYKIRIITYN